MSSKHVVQFRVGMRIALRLERYKSTTTVGLKRHNVFRVGPSKGRATSNMDDVAKHRLKLCTPNGYPNHYIVVAGEECEF